MPTRPGSPCRYPGCSAVTRNRYCDAHRAGVAEHSAEYCADSLRPSAPKRGYDRAWARLRAAVLEAEPDCRACKADGRTVVAACVDHIIPLARGGTNDMSNLQPLCWTCHSRKTVRENGGFGNVRGRKRRYS